MTTDPLQKLLDTAQTAGLISAAQSEQVTRVFARDRPATMQDAASALVAKNVLTQDQAKRLVGALESESVLAGRYQVIEKLGEGGMGAVYKALDTKLGRVVAIKVLASHQAQHADAVARFHREAKALARVSHPAIVQAYDADQDGERPFLVMELIDGINLSQLMHEKGKLSPTRAADYVYQAALGIQHAHERGLVHRDLKPANLLVTGDGQTKILDLGLARFAQDLLPDSQVTREGTGLGTPDYMAPEQFADARHVDRRADIYALGCTLYHLVTGRVPFPGSSLSEKATAHESAEPAPIEELCPDAPAGLAMAIARMMAKDPADRFQSAHEVAEALAPYVATSSPSVRKIAGTTSWEGSRLSFTVTSSRSRKRLGARAMIGAGFVAAALIGLVFAWPWLFPGPATNQEPPDPIVEQKLDDKDAKDAKPTRPNVVTIPNGLTVAKNGTGQHSTIKEALEKVESGMTIRVLDDATYQETLVINRAGTQTGITLEATGGATLLFPAGKLGCFINGVPRVTLRGFRIRHEAAMTYLIAVAGKSQGLLFAGLDFKVNLPTCGAITLEGLEPAGGPSVVENCTIHGGRVGLRVSGYLDYATPFPCGNMVFRNNTILDSEQAILLMGSVKNIQVVGNRTAFSTLSGIQLENLLPGSEQILIANNTVLECKAAFRLWDNGTRKEFGKNVTLANNLFLGSTGPDAVFFDSGGDIAKVRGSGDGKALLKQWTWKNNWRETTQPAGSDVYSRAWIPIADGDIRQDSIEVQSRSANQPAFLKLARDSALAKAGVGGDLPAWVGAEPPDGTEPWDWRWTWDAIVENRLTVSQEAAAGGRMRTLSEALDRVRSGMTIRVLDKGTYAESLVLSSASTQTGITLESPHGAVLSADRPSGSAVVVKGVAGVTLRGFRLRADAPKLTMVYIKESAPGLLLDRLVFEPGKDSGYDGVLFYKLTSGDADPPAIVQNCTMHKPQIGVGIMGFDFAKSYHVCRGVAVRNNLILEPQNLGIHLKGHVERIQVVGNRIGQSARFSALQLEDLSPDTRDVLLANNTVCDVPHAFRLWDRQVKGERVRICNNLFLACSNPDMVFFDSGGDPVKVRGPGDGGMCHKHWSISHNWRETSPPIGEGLMEKSWIPPSKDDVLKDRIEVVSRLPTHLDYVKPPPQSPLATAGVGGDMPAYIGALPPEGVPAWDWDKPWQKWAAKKD